MLFRSSGSMEDSIGGLKNAVTSFVKNREDAESVSLVAFNDAISGKMGFGTSDDGLLSFAEGMEAGGGTDIYSAVLSCLDTFPQNPDSNNVLIVMTDGQDNYYHDAADINKNIGELAAERNVLFIQSVWEAQWIPSILVLLPRVAEAVLYMFLPAAACSPFTTCCIPSYIISTD